MSEINAPWWVTVVGSFVGGTAITLFQVVQWASKRRDDSAQQQKAVEDKRDELLLRESTSLHDRLTGEIDRQTAVIARLRRLLDEADADRQEGWELAWFW